MKLCSVKRYPIEDISDQRVFFIPTCKTISSRNDTWSYTRTSKDPFKISLIHFFIQKKWKEQSISQQKVRNHTRKERNTCLTLQFMILNTVLINLKELKSNKHIAWLSCLWNESWYYKWIFFQRHQMSVQIGIGICPHSPMKHRQWKPAGMALQGTSFGKVQRQTLGVGEEDIAKFNHSKYWTMLWGQSEQMCVCSIRFIITNVTSFRQ